jgi:hypothetical protein
VLFVPNDFFDAEHAAKLRPFFQVPNLGSSQGI